MLAFIALLIIPQTRKPISISINRLLSFAPAVIGEEDQQSIDTYHWQLQTLSGKQVDFSDSKGKVILLNFWATWCAPCIAEMPTLQALYNDYGERVDFYFVSSDQEKLLKNFMAKNKYSFPVFMPLQNAPEVLEGRMLPTTYLIDKKGNIVIKETGTADWNSEAMRQTLDHLLKKS